MEIISTGKQERSIPGGNSCMGLILNKKKPSNQINSATSHLKELLSEGHSKRREATNTKFEKKTSIAKEERKQILEIKYAIINGYDRDFICENYAISKSKYYKIHACYGRFNLIGKELNEQIKNKKKLDYKLVYAIKNEFSRLNGEITYRSISLKYGLSVQEILNILYFRKHKNIGKRFNRAIESIYDNHGRKRVKLKINGELQSKTEIANKYFNQSNETFITNILIPQKQMVDLILFSPPYNMKRDFYDQYKDSLTQIEYLERLTNLFQKFNSILSKDRVVLMNISYSASNPSLPEKVITEIEEKTNFSVADKIIWEKQGCTPNAANNRLDRIVEYIYVLSRKDELVSFHINKGYKVGKNGLLYQPNVKRNIIGCKNGKSTKENKATFSVTLVKQLIAIYGKKGDLVFDPFMGTGTTGVASLLSDCSFVGTEISADQVNHSNHRIIKPSRFVKLKRILNHVNSIRTDNESAPSGLIQEAS